jgi:hypothetical protein
MNRWLTLCFLLSLPLVACASKRVPPGTPPPEYERRPVEPWPSAAPVEPPVVPQPPAIVEPPAVPAPPAEVGAPVPDAGLVAPPATPSAPFRDAGAFPDAGVH